MALLPLHDLPALNAILNSLATVLLVTGYVFIRRRRMKPHRFCMLAAIVVSAAFLTSYLIYHAQVGDVPFPGHGAVRLLYFVILIPHVILAVFVLPLALVTATLGLRARYAKHRRIARWTFPVWLYVSVTGVIIYVMLYRLY
jgi:putative membrane protein